MNIHSGVFRPRLISREIDEESRTFYQKIIPPPPPPPPTSNSLGMLAEWHKFISQKKKGKEERKKLPGKARDGLLFKLDVQTAFFLVHI